MDHFLDFADIVFKWIGLTAAVVFGAAGLLTVAALVWAIAIDKIVRAFGVSTWIVRYMFNRYEFKAWYGKHRARPGDDAKTVRCTAKDQSN